MEIFKAKKIMTTDVAYVKKDTPIYEAIKILIERNITGLPVVNDDMSIAGIISEKDVLKLLYDIEDAPGNVEDFMTKGIVTFNEDDSVVDIAECFIKNNFRRVVITSGGKLAGIISRRDIIEIILDLRRKGKSLKK
ncbi:MAG: CBS domain-containing protein [Sedimentisphaerales bacterium]|nr:CBS domain-containing protein [Sedimentisphaerales bacterium]